ncbi:MAG: hypothetical protein QW261_12405 [Candidatus Jordarchaeaceae archaeon]
MKLVIDLDSLIKLTKVGVKDIILDNVEVYLPPKVREECVTVAKKEGFADAFEIDENLRRDRIREKESVRNPDVEEEIKNFGLGEGEADVFRLFKSGNFDAVSSDDSKFIRILNAFNIPYLTPSAVILHIYWKGALNLEETREIIKKLKNLVSEEEYHLAMEELGGEESEN